MKKLLFLLPLFSLLSINAYAEKNADHNAEVKCVKMKSMKSKRAHKMKKEIRTLVVNYKMEQGDLTKEELEIHRAEGKASKQELKELRKNGDQEALDARLEEMRIEREARRVEFQAYLEEHPALATAIEAKKLEIKQKREAKKQARKEKNAAE